jgi:hypothetical protein
LAQVLQKVQTVKVLGDHRVSKIVAPDQAVVVQAADQVVVVDQVAEEITRTPDLD